MSDRPRERAVTGEELEAAIEHHRADDDVPVEEEQAALAELEYPADETNEG
jgi:hypothetical protein